MKIVIGNYPNADDSRNLILNDKVVSYYDNSLLSPLYALITKVEGLETAPYRNGTGDWSGTDGGYLSSQLYSARTITISGAYIDKRFRCSMADQSSDPFDHMARLYIRSRLPIRTKQYMRIFLDNGLTFLCQGYCTDIKMDYVNAEYGDYQITFYCPEPALYRGDEDGTIGSEWSTSTLFKEKTVGYVNPAKMTKTHDIIWGAGGRSTPIVYTGDMEYSPQLIVAPAAGEHITNPQFYSVNEGKTFGLGYPQTSIAQFKVKSVNSQGAVTSVEVIEKGGYDADYSANGILMQNFSGNTGDSCKLNLVMRKNDQEVYEVSSCTIKSGGENYRVNDILTPYIAGAAIFTMTGGQKLVIDMLEHTVTLDGASRSYYITPGSEWFKLQALSTNNIVFMSASSTDTQTAEVRWRNGYQGI